METELQTKKTKLTKKAKYLANPDVKRWNDNVARGSPITAEVRLRRLYHFCEVHGMTPTEFAELAMKDVRTATDLIQDHITWMEEKGHSPGYIATTLTAIKSWLHHHDLQIKRRIKIRNADATPTLENERVPEGAELAELFNRANLRAGACMALMAKAGLRPEVIANHDASDGLMIKDLPDLAIVQGLATFIRNPPRIIVRKNLSKAGHEYFSFLTPVGAKKLLAYLNERIMSEESLGPESPVIAPFRKYRRFRGENEGSRFPETTTIQREIRKTMRPRFRWRPYVLRAFFDTELLIAESRGKIAHDFRVFFMGHKGSIEAKYTTNKGILPQALVNEMREAFTRSIEFLDLEISEIDPLEKQKEEMRAKLEQMTPEQLAKVQELVSLMTGGKTDAGSGSSQAKTQSSSSDRVGNTLEPYQTEKSSSKIMIRKNSCSGPGGIRKNCCSESSPIFVSVRGYPEEDPKVIVKSKVLWRNGRCERFMGIYDVLGAD